MGVAGAAGIWVGVAVGLAVGLGLGLGLGQSLIGTLRPAVGWPAAAYGTPTRAAGTWLVTKGVSPDPTPAKPPSAPWLVRKAVSTSFDPFDHFAAAGSIPALRRASSASESESGSLAEPHAVE